MHNQYKGHEKRIGCIQNVFYCIVMDVPMHRDIPGIGLNPRKCIYINYWTQTGQFADSAENACKTTLDTYLDPCKFFLKTEISTRSYDDFTEGAF